MGIEIERKYLVLDHSFKEEAISKTLIRQGFLNDDPQRVVRVRIMGDKATLTIKGPLGGASRHEFELPLPLADADLLIREACIPPALLKTRYVVDHGGFEWEVDEFHGANDGLLIAEVELADERQQPGLPPWVGKEVTGDVRYYNAYLVRNPYSGWRTE